MVFRMVPGTTDSGTRIWMGSSLKRGASFSFTTVTTTVALLTGTLGALELSRFRLATVRTRVYSDWLSKSRGYAGKVQIIYERVDKINYWHLLNKIIYFISYKIMELYVIKVIYH